MGFQAPDFGPAHPGSGPVSGTVDVRLASPLSPSLLNAAIKKKLFGKSSNI